MNQQRPLEETQQTLTEHIDAALEDASDDDAVFHLRQAKQVAMDLPAVVAEKADNRSD